MKKIKVLIEGETPLLMNSPKAMVDNYGKKIRKTTENYDPKEEAEKVCYRTAKRTLFIPKEAIKGALINASSFKKIGRYSAKPIIASAVRIIPDEIEILDKRGKPIKKYDIDMRTVVIQRARVVKSRPKIEDWKAEFYFTYNEKMIGDTDIIKTILTEAGERVGILDFRPMNKGEFGCFKITKWEEL